MTTTNRYIYESLAEFVFEAGNPYRIMETGVYYILDTFLKIGIWDDHFSIMSAREAQKNKTTIVQVVYGPNEKRSSFGNYWNEVQMSLVLNNIHPEKFLQEFDKKVQIPKKNHFGFYEKEDLDRIAKNEFPQLFDARNNSPARCSIRVFGSKQVYFPTVKRNEVDLTKIGDRWSQSQIMRAIFAGQVEQVFTNHLYSDDYYQDYKENFSKNLPVSLIEFAELVIKMGKPYCCYENTELRDGQHRFVRYSPYQGYSLTFVVKDPSQHLEAI